MILQQATSAAGHSSFGKKGMKDRFNYRSFSRRRSTIAKPLLALPPKPDLINKVKSFLPCIIFFGIVVMMTGAIFTAEKYSPKQIDIRTAQGHRCIHKYGIGAAGFYVLSAITTIGYGEFRPCTLAGKIIGAVCTLVGVPFFLIVLSDFGKKLCSGIKEVVHSKYYQLFKSLISKAVDYLKPVKKDNKSDIMRTVGVSVVPVAGVYKNGIVEGLLANKDKACPEELENMPVSVGVILSLACIFTCSVYYFKEFDCGFANSIYYAILTFIDGDFACSRFELAIPVFLLVLLGFSMFSLTITMIQLNLENTIQATKAKMQLAMKNAKSLKARSMSKQFDDSLLNVDDLIDKIVEDVAGPLGKSMISAEELEKLKLDAIRQIDRKDVGSQVNPRELLENPRKRSYRKPSCLMVDKSTWENPLMHVATKQTCSRQFSFDISTGTAAVEASERAQQTRPPRSSSKRIGCPDCAVSNNQTDPIVLRDNMTHVEPKRRSLDTETDHYHNMCHAKIMVSPRKRSAKVGRPL